MTRPVWDEQATDGLNAARGLHLALRFAALVVALAVVLVLVVLAIVKGWLVWVLAVVLGAFVLLVGRRR